jgi:hypothetical protein
MFKAMTDFPEAFGLNAKVVPGIINLVPDIERSSNHGASNFPRDVERAKLTLVRWGGS